MHRFAPLILAVALFMEQMDSTVIATSLPAIAADLAVGPITLKLAMTSYLVALGVFIPLSGWAADRFGAKRVFLIAIGVFMAGSVLCAVSGSLISFVMARFLQGMGGSMMTPVGRAILLRSTKKSELVSAMAMFTIPGVIGPLVGPPIGGFITTYFNWEWIFLINVPIGFIGIALSVIYLPRIDSPPPPPADLVGFVLSGIGAAGIVFGLSVVSLPALPPAIGVAATAIGALSTLLFIGHARRHPHPVLDLGLFRIETFRVCVTSGTIFRIAMGAVPFLLPLMLQLGFGFSAFHSGLITFVAAGGALFTKFVARRVFLRFGFRRTLLAAATASAVGTAANAFFFPDTPYIVLIGILFLTGFVRSFFFTGINILGFADIERNQTSQATALNAVIQQISGALGVAFAGIILEIHAVATGQSLGIASFHIAFLCVAVLNIAAAFPISRLPAGAGSAVSGHRIDKIEEELP
ncbi:multidrug efflux MFS transporter [Rhizobium sp. KVB221]|uniref:Multidrug efflux MFS transporter n=1 Tax=Rhizobium setariae TaxID=2801340 RepID=A0A937CNT2_9HYPH|nr:MDR family MFS transporter [Rhizobium setariae]MBL0371573.1 multidrug efflux MFS transporter [Rhizobium setariae]